MPTLFEPSWHRFRAFGVRVRDTRRGYASGIRVRHPRPACASGARL